MIKTLTQLLLSVCFLFFTVFDVNAQAGASKLLDKSNYLEGVVMLKIKEEYKSVFSQSKTKNKKFDAFTKSRKIKSLKPAFARKGASYTKSAKSGVDLSLIYRIELGDGESIEKAINDLYKSGMVYYAEPFYLPKLLYTPNDDSIAIQTHLENANILAGWDINKGDTNIVIGISDTGVDLDHPDFVGNIKYNYADPINGSDDDGDGYIDNYYGWDVGEDDNDPSSDGQNFHHGVAVTGIAGATADNSIGIAGSGFKCKIMPLKITDADGELNAGYASIVYGADHGCDVINCSWGNTTYSYVAQDVINYAAVDNDVLIVSAAGNANDTIPYYPGSYDHVLCVTAIDDTVGVKKDASNWNIYVDVAVQGDNVLTTYFNDTYVATGGTSMAAPIVAGCAGIVRAQFPWMTADQVAQQIKSTTDRLDTIAGNAPYLNGLGSGKMNLYEALTDSTVPGIILSNEVLEDHNDNNYKEDDTLDITATFTNLLFATSNLSVSISSASPYVQIIDTTAALGVIEMNGTANNSGDPFQIKILSGVPSGELVIIEFTYTDGTYSGKDYITILLNQDFVDIDVNDISASIFGNARIAYSDLFQSAGNGFFYQGNALMYEGGLMIAGSPATVVDNLRNETPPANNNHFAIIETAKEVSPAQVSDFDVYGKVNDSNGGAASMSLDIDQRAYAWNDVGHENYIMMEYKVINNGTDITDLYVGLCLDWDLLNSEENRITYNSGLKLGITESTAGTLFSGIKLLSSDGVTHYAIDNSIGGEGGVDINSGFSSAEKYTTLTTNRDNAGVAGSGNDVIDVLSSGPIELLSGDSVKVAFALIGGFTKTSVEIAAANAQAMYDAIYTPTADVENVLDVQITSIVPNPASQVAVINADIKEDADINVQIINLQGQVVKEIYKESLDAGSHRFTVNVADMENGVYFCRLIKEKYSVTERFVVSH